MNKKDKKLSQEGLLRTRPLGVDGVYKTKADLRTKADKEKRADEIKLRLMEIQSSLDELKAKRQSKRYRAGGAAVASYDPDMAQKYFNMANNIDQNAESSAQKKAQYEDDRKLKLELAAINNVKDPLEQAYKLGSILDNYLDIKAERVKLGQPTDDIDKMIESISKEIAAEDPSYQAAFRNGMGMSTPETPEEKAAREKKEEEEEEKLKSSTDSTDPEEKEDVDLADYKSAVAAIPKLKTVAEVDAFRTEWLNTDKVLTTDQIADIKARLDKQEKKVAPRAKAKRPKKTTPEVVKSIQTNVDQIIIGSIASGLNVTDPTDKFRLFKVASRKLSPEAVSEGDVTNSAGKMAAIVNSFIPGPDQAERTSAQAKKDREIIKGDYDKAISLTNKVLSPTDETYFANVSEITVKLISDILEANKWKSGGKSKKSAGAPKFKQIKSSILNPTYLRALNAIYKKIQQKIPLTPNEKTNAATWMGIHKGKITSGAKFDEATKKKGSK